MKLIAAAVALVLVLAGGAQEPMPRPRILGISHVGFHVSDMPAALRFYGDFLGLQQTAPLPGAGSRPEVVVVRINDRQWIELFGGRDTGEGQLHHVAVETDDVERMRAYVMSRGASEVSPVGKGPTGHGQFFLTDPDGHRIAFVQAVAKKAAASPTPGISNHALHAGILVGDLARANAFYRGTLGFDEIWRGNAVTSKTLSWVNMRVPDGTDYLEFMLYDQKPAPDRRGSAHHLCLLVPDAAKAVAALESNPARAAYTRAIEIRTGVNRKRQVNLFDPDGTRVELMEPHTIDGVPAPSSTLPPPR